MEIWNIEELLWKPRGQWSLDIVCAVDSCYFNTLLNIIIIIIIIIINNTLIIKQFFEKCNTNSQFWQILIFFKKNKFNLTSNFSYLRKQFIYMLHCSEPSFIIHDKVKLVLTINLYLSVFNLYVYKACVPQLIHSKSSYMRIKIIWEQTSYSRTTKMASARPSSTSLLHLCTLLQ